MTGSEKAPLELSTLLTDKQSRVASSSRFFLSLLLEL
jgi:hypothetical protein